MKMRYLAAVAWLALASPAFAAQGSGCLPTTGTVSGLSMTQYINQAIAALISGNSGASAPSTDCTSAPVKGQTWLDTSVTPNVEKRYDGTSWVTVGAIDASNHLWSPPVGGGMASITAAATTDICAAPAAVQNISGTTAIIGFGSGCVVGLRKTLVFNSATPLTYNATSLILPAQRDYITSPGDVADAIYLGAGNWRVVSVTKIDGNAVTNPATPVGTILYGQWGTIPAKTVYGVGQALSRLSYPDYFAAMTRVQSGTLTAGNNTITGLSNTSGFGPGMPVEAAGVQAGTTIASVTSSTIVMSQTATANGSQSVRVFVTGYGSSGDSTTVGVSDCRGRTMAGRDNMNFSAANRLTASYFGVQALQIGGAGGIEGYLQAQNQLPNIAPTFSGFNDPVNVSLDGGLWGGINGFQARGDSGTIPLPAGLTGMGSSGTFTPRGSISSINGNVTQVGTPNVQPTLIAECVVAVLP